MFKPQGCIYIKLISSHMYTWKDKLNAHARTININIKDNVLFNGMFGLEEIEWAFQEEYSFLKECLFHQDDKDWSFHFNW